MSRQEPTVTAATWVEHEREIRSVRHAVFVIEQGVPEDLDFDDRDSGSLHALARLGGEVVATGRIQPDGHIGRIAVLKAYRGGGIGAAIVRFLVGAARRWGLGRVYLDAQVSAEGFYERLGFRRMGGVFMEAGIEHIRMERDAGPPSR
jgi:predicted GNAT family N-acyltransferase